MATPDDMRQFLAPPNADLIDQQKAMDPNEAPYVAAGGRPNEHETGILYKAPYEMENDGVCFAARRHACALRATGIPVFLQSHDYVIDQMGVRSLVRYGELAESVHREVDHLTGCTIHRPSIAIHHFVPTEEVVQNLLFPRAMMAFTPNGAQRIRSSMILFCAFERDKISPRMAGMFNLAAEVWVPCQWNAKVLRDSGVSNAIQVMPHPHFEDDPFVGVERPSLTRPLRLLNVGKWEPRKDHHTLIGAFLRAFKPTNNVELVLKTRDYGTWKHYPKSAGESISSWLCDQAVRDAGWNAENATSKIRILDKTLPRDILAKVYAESDVYVASGRGEGFDLPAFDAKLAGLTLVYCPTSGSPDFADNGDVCVAGPMAACDPMYNWGKEAKWSGYTVEDLAVAIKTAAVRRLHPIARLFDRTPYTMAAVGWRMRARCNAIVKRCGGDIEAINVP